jgi:hypothetical protein
VLLEPGIFADRLFESRQDLVGSGLPGGRYVAAVGLLLVEEQRRG